MFCPHCGSPIEKLKNKGNTYLCPKCGGAVDNSMIGEIPRNDRTISISAKIFAVFSILSCLAYIVYGAIMSSSSEYSRLNEWQVSTISAVMHLLVIVSCVALLIGLFSKIKAAAFITVFLSGSRIVYAIIDAILVSDSRYTQSEIVGYQPGFRGRKSPIVEEISHFKRMPSVQPYTDFSKEWALIASITWNALMLLSIILISIYIIKNNKSLGVISCSVAVIFFLLSGVVCWIESGVANIAAAYIDAAGYLAMVFAVFFCMSPRKVKTK